MMTPLGMLFRSGSSKPPKIDQHSLFTSIQVSAAVLEGDLQVYEPWKRKRCRPKECHVTLYVNETSPFLVWHKLSKGKNTQHIGSVSTGDAVASPTVGLRPRCVISVSRAKLAKTTGGSFELTDFASNLTFRFITRTIGEAEMWVKKLSEESRRESNLDMRSICSSCSSVTSSTSSFPSPDVTQNDLSNRFFPSVGSDPTTPKKHKKSASFSDTTGAIIQLLDDDGPEEQVSRSPFQEQSEIFVDHFENEDLFGVKTTASHIAASRLGHTRSNSKTFPRTQASKVVAAREHQHIRAQPHLGLHTALDKHRPELRNMVSDLPREHKIQRAFSDRSELPFSEYFVNVPNT